MGLLGRAILAFWHDVAPGGEAEFDAWHTREHMPERLAVPGFLRARRYASLGGPPRFFYFYETEDASTLQSGPYLERLNSPTPWTRQCIQLIRNNKRTACEISATLGRGLGGAVATIEFGPGAGRDEPLRRWLTTEALPALLERPGITGAHLGEANVAATTVRTAEKALLDRPDALTRWVAIVEGIEGGAVAAAHSAVLPPEGLAARGAHGECLSGLYRLTFSLDRDG